MRLDVAFTPAEVAGGTVGDRSVVVIDVLRATSTMVEALANGARAIFPVENVAEAARIAGNIGRDQAVLAGERHCVRIDGFDLGNSPLEFTPERVAGRPLVMSTTNGTAALLAVAGAKRVLLGSMLNVSATAAALLEQDDAMLLVCAGREKRFALEDAICAGALCLLLYRKLGKRHNWSDSALAAAQLARRHLPRLARTLRRSAAGRQLVELGFDADVEFCASVDRYAVVPKFRDRQITL
ncbi:MAG TPA: 2-phosphosulfolactate phosphatase [Longimicrobiales bacterium]|nr:2-phosphosulfolactate phosphatase [Longimicrobiales bacterium]